jgi:hypothetical protein
MGGPKFLNPYLKVVICAVGVVSMAYLVYPDLIAGRFSDTLTAVRVLVMIGFGYLLAKSVGQLIADRQGKDG